MQNLYHAHRTAKEEAITINALGEKIRRLEQALDDAQAPHKNLAGNGTLDGHILLLREEIGILNKTNYKMRNCGNCSEEYCDGLTNNDAVQDCKDDDRIEWSLDYATD
jgi:hypothetical protein